MAEFEGNTNLNEETSELEVEDIFELTEDKLSEIAGGVIVRQRQYPDDYGSSPGMDLNDIICEEGPYQLQDRISNGYSHVAGKYGPLGWVKC